MKEELAISPLGTYHILICSNELCDFMDLRFTEFESGWLCSDCQNWKISYHTFLNKLYGEKSDE